jgi:hypothetical protein
MMVPRTFLGNSATAAEMVTERASGRAFHRSGPGRRHMFLMAVVLVLAWGMIYYYLGVLLPIRAKTTLGGWGIGGYQSDLYPRWLGARELLWHHRNPYSQEMTEEIERGFYGRPIDPAMRRQVDPEAFAYPVYVTFLLAPLLPLPFEVARTVFTAILVLLTLGTFPLWIRALSLRLGRWAGFVAFAAMMSSYAVLEALRLGQITLLVSFFMAASVAALGSGWPLTAGILLALSLVKPQLSYLLIAFVLIWSVGGWRDRKKVALGFAAMTALLLVGSTLILPGWFGLWREAIAGYISWHRGSLLAALLAARTTPIVIGGLLSVCGLLFWRFRAEPVGSAGFNFAVVTALSVTSVVLPNAGGGSFYNQILLLPAALWLFTSGRTLSKNYAPARVTWLFAAGVLTAEWILAFAVSFAAFVIHYRFRVESSLFVGGPELLMYGFPGALALFIACAMSQLWRAHE